MVRVSGTRNDVPDTWASRVTYTWDKQRLALSLELADERPSLAKMLKALALQASSEGGGASSTLGGLLAERNGGQTGGGGAAAGISVADTVGDAVASAVSLEFARGTVSSPSDGSAVYTPASASVQGLGEVQLAPSGGTTAGQVVQANDARLSDSRVPMGAAGGDLGGNYPNPSVAAIRGSAVAPTAPSDGQVLAWSAGAKQYQPVTPSAQASSATPSGAAGGDLAGSYPNPTLAAAGTAGTYGDGSHYAIITTDAKGRVTSAASQLLPAQASSLPPSGAAGGDLAGSYPNPALAVTGTAGTYGDAAHYAIITTDAKGRVTAAGQQVLPVGFAAGAVIAPASVAAGMIIYSGASMLVQWHAKLGSVPASGAVAFYGWETSSDGSTWTSEAYSVEGVYTGASFGSGSQYARCRAYALTPSGTTPTPSAWTASAAQAYVAATASSAGLTVQGTAGQTALNFVGGSVASVGGVSVYTPPTVTPNGIWMPTVKPAYGALINTGQPLASGLVALMPFNEGSGTAVHDVTSYANTFNLTNAPLWTTFADGSGGLRFNVTAAGVVSQSAGQSIAMQTGKLSALANAPGFTWIGRAYLYSGGYTNNYAHYFTLLVAGQANSTMFYLRPDQNNNGELSWFVSGSSGASIIYGPAWSTLVGGWHQIAVTYNNSSGAAALYVDGALSTSGTFMTGVLTTATANATCSYEMCGSNSGSVNLAADWDFAAIWNRALAASEVASVYASPYWAWLIGQRAARAVSSAYALIDNGEVLVLANASSGGFAVTLPPYYGRALPITVVKTDSASNAVTVVYGGATLATLTAQNQARRIESTGAGYVVTAGYL